MTLPNMHRVTFPNALTVTTNSRSGRAFACTSKGRKSNTCGIGMKYVHGVPEALSRHFKQCNIVFQCALLGLIHENGRGVATVFGAWLPTLFQQTGRSPKDRDRAKSSRVNGSGKPDAVKEERPISSGGLQQEDP